MLQEGLRLKQQHVDVVIGYLGTPRPPRDDGASPSIWKPSPPRMARGGRRFP